MTAVLERNLISVPGAYDIPAEQYHADPVEGGSLSSSGARKILDSPARFRYDLDHPSPTTKAFDLGHAAHRLVLGAGADWVLVDRERWDTKDVKAEVADIRAAGRVPIKRSDFEAIHAMAAAIHQHPLARALLDLADDGIPEQVLVWQDPTTGVWRRSMLDYRVGRTIVDYKTTTSASPAAFARAVATYGYHQQDAYYRDGVTALGLADDPAFVFVVQEKEPPYLVAVYDLDDEAVRIGRERNRRALEVYRDCTEAGLWPGYSTDIETIALPRWVERQHDQEYA
jgi:hypothetical protein